MARKSARSVIKNYQIHRKDIDERIKQNPLLKQKRHKRKRETLKKTRSIINVVQKFRGGWTLDNFDKKLRNLNYLSNQKRAVINQPKYHN